MKNVFKLNFAIFMIAIIFQGCQPETSDTSDTSDAPDEVNPVDISPNSEADIAVVQSYIDALLKADSVTLRSVTTSDFQASLVKNPIDSSGIDEVISSWAANLKTRSNQTNETVAVMSVRVNEGPYQGDWVQYWGNYSASMNETGVDIIVPYFINTRMKNGKMDRSFSYYDRLAIFEAQGYKLELSDEED